ncbi:MAG TPA: flagellar biosynthesis anti-sigma factor FlgM [Terracidiphilus sp.]|jgi:negative regulator of flagellin synthesis FlgM
MDIRSSLEGLKSLLGTQATTSVAQPPKNPSTTSGSGLGSDSATFSSAASEVSQTAGDGGVRMDKVASIQAALASGSYSINPAAIASRLVDSMLASHA